MSLRGKVTAIVIVMALCVFIKADSIFAGWWEGTDLPLPQNTSEVKKEVRKMVGLEYAFTYYSSGQKASALKDFYSKKLSQQGWKQRDLSAGISKMELPEGAPKIDTGSFSKAAESTLLFENDKETLTITFLPDEYSRDGKTKFTVCRGRIPQSAEDFDMNQLSVPELVAKPKKDVYPVYPQASLIHLSEGERNVKATYFTKDTIEQVNLFYKNEMSKYSWYLEDEKPPTLMTKDNASKYSGVNDCPSCAQSKLIAGTEPLEALTAELDFINSKKDVCHIMVAQVLPAKGQGKSLDMTTISVNYEESAK